MDTVKIGRKLFVGCFLIALTIGICIRLVYLHILEEPFLKAKGEALTQRSISLPPHRGMILDRNGQALAVSTSVKSIWVNTVQANVQDRKWHQVEKYLQLPHHHLVKKIKQNPHRSFLYIKRHIEPQLAKKILDLHLAGVYAQTEYRRFYPTAEVFSQVIGHTSIDHIGQEGIELAYNAQLQGKPGKQRVLKDRTGLSVEPIGQAIQSTPGEDIVLSLDTRIQYLAYRNLLKACQTHQAKSGSLVVLDVDTFEVLAMVNVPAYNPNMEHAHNDYIRNRAVTDVFEPGSVMKPFSMVHVLAHRNYPLMTTIDTAPGVMHIGNRTVKDLHNYGTLDLTQIIQKSSNVGIAQLMLGLEDTQAKDFYQFLDTLGLGSVSHSGFPGERTGRIIQAGKRDPFALATLSFGYGLSLTPLQLAQAYAILASGGIKRPIALLKTNTQANDIELKQKSVDDKTAQAIKLVNSMLRATADNEGTASRAQVEGYTVAGKTGTVRKVLSDGQHMAYSQDKHIAVFAGFAPASHPKLVIAVIIDEPEVKYYGGEVCAPVFAKVMQGALRILAVPRDRAVELGTGIATDMPKNI